MSQTGEPMSAEAAEKAYEAAAAEAVAKAETAPAPAPLAFPAKQARVAAPKVKASSPVQVAPVQVAPVKVASVKKIKQAVKKVAAPTKPAPAIATKPVQPLKEKIMTAKTTTDFTKTIKGYAAEAQAKAKTALAKGSEVVGEVSEFAKGNVDAVVASGKVLGAGLQDLGKTYAAEGKAAVEAVTADVKKIAQVKSPVEFVQTQSEILKKNFDHAIDFNAKTSETMIKLFGAAFAPLSARANLAIEKVKKAA